MTPRQQAYVDAWKKHGSQRAAAKALGVNDRTFTRAIARAAKKLPELHAKKAPPGYRLRGVSTLLDSAGEPVQTWVKTATDPIDPETAVWALRDAIAGANVPARTSRPMSTSHATPRDSLTVMPIGDPALSASSPWAP